MIKNYTNFITEEIIQPEEKLLETIKRVIKKVKKKLVLEQKFLKLIQQLHFIH